MFVSRRRHVLLLTSIVVAAWAAWPTQAAAQGLLGFLFAAPRASTPAPVLHPVPARPDHASAAADQPAQTGASSGRSVTYCVRLCDGRFFPVQAAKGASAAQLCHAFCPASPTRIFSGSEIRYAVATDGSRYGHLANAFAYRKRLAPDCTCNGKDNFGLAPIAASADPTLRAGDVVVAERGRGSPRP
jgi:Protein of unknown function (DUF2865)